MLKKSIKYGWKFCLKNLENVLVFMILLLREEDSNVVFGIYIILYYK